MYVYLLENCCSRSGPILSGSVYRRYIFSPSFDSYLFGSELPNCGQSNKKTVRVVDATLKSDIYKMRTQTFPFTAFSGLCYESEYTNCTEFVGGLKTFAM